MATRETLSKGTIQIPKICDYDNHSTWEVFFKSHILRYGNKVVRALIKEIPVNETEEQANRREQKHKKSNAKAFSYLSEACMGSGPASLVLKTVVQKAKTKPVWANTLLKALNDRFNISVGGRVSKMLTEFSELEAKEGEKSGAEFVDRVKSSVSAIEDLNPLQTPTDFAITTKLTEGIREQFPILYEALKLLPEPMPKEELMAKISNAQPTKFLLAGSVASRAVTPLGLDADVVKFLASKNIQKKKFHWQKKQNKPKKTMEDTKHRTKNCFTCNSPDHLARDCPANKEEKRDDKKRKKERENSYSNKNKKKFRGKKNQSLPWMKTNGDEISDSDRSFVIFDTAMHIDGVEQLVCLDSGCNRLLMKNRDLFDTYQEFDGPAMQTAATGGSLEINGVGDVGIFGEVRHCINATVSIVGEAPIMRLGWKISKYLDEDGNLVAYLKKKMTDEDYFIDAIVINDLFFYHVGEIS